MISLLPPICFPNVCILGTKLKWASGLWSLLVYLNILIWKLCVLLFRCIILIYLLKLFIFFFQGIRLMRLLSSRILEIKIPWLFLISWFNVLGLLEIGLILLFKLLKLPLIRIKASFWALVPIHLLWGLCHCIRGDPLVIHKRLFDQISSTPLLEVTGILLEGVLSSRWLLFPKLFLLFFLNGICHASWLWWS